MPPEPPVTWPEILNWLISLLLLISAFFLVRFFKTHDENMAKNSAIQEGLISQISEMKVVQAVHAEKHVRTEARLEDLEEIVKNS